jgi:hypothetical protein
MNEVWKYIEGYNNKYMVSDLGNVMILPYISEQGHFLAGRLLSPTDNGRGYQRVNFNNETKYLHRLVAQTFLPNPQNKEEVNHVDGNKKNNVLYNLEWVTPDENRQHAVINNLIPHSENHHFSKLDRNQVLKIKKLFNQGERQIDIARTMGISHKTIHLIVRGRIWRRVQL